MEKEFSNHIEVAHFQSYQSFLTSYLIGCREQKIVESKSLLHELPEALKKRASILILFQDIFIPIISESLTGLHTFDDKAFLYSHKKFSPISFATLTAELSLREKASAELSSLFQDRVARSFETISALLQDKEDDLFNLGHLKDLSFGKTEAALVFGHFAHPYPKLQELALGENVKELESALNLKWCFAHRSIIHLEFSKCFSNEVITQILDHTFQADQNALPEMKNDYVLFPFHPIQYADLLKEAFFQDYINKQLIIEIKTSSYLQKWTPTTSMRSIYNFDCRWMLKFSLPVRLTNSIRTLQENEVKRGVQLHEVFSSPEALEMKKEISPLTILHEPFFMALKDINGQIQKSTIVVFRENPFYQKMNPIIALATLNQFSPVNQRPLLVTLINKIAEKENSSVEIITRKWFASFLDKAIMPFVLLQARHGIYLGAHQQNLILELDENFYPGTSYYRDCQGSGYSQLGFEKFKKTAESLQNPNGNVLPNEFANTLIGYYLFINSTLFTIKTLANMNTEMEKDLIKDFTVKLSQLPNVIDPSFINYILGSKTFLIKDNFECCLKNINENVIDNPLKIYKEFKNPFYTGVV